MEKEKLKTVGAGPVSAHTSKARQNNGITLIALVITIIVMLILVAVTISMAVNGGLFEYAQSAGRQTNEAKDAEQLLASGKVNIDNVIYNSIDEYISGTKVEDDDVTQPPEDDNGTYDETEKDANGLLTANATYKNGGYTAVVPKGFAIVPGVNGTTAIADGLVITDKLDAQGNSIGNEFVWIPVSVSSSATETACTNQYASLYATARAEYNEMLGSVSDNKGFYMGRYESGSQKEDVNGNLTAVARSGNGDGTSDVVVKRDQYPYIYVGFGIADGNYQNDVTYNGVNYGKGALALSKAMYAGKDVGVTSTLCYNIQWNQMLDFIENEKNISNSLSWGNHPGNGVLITRTSAKILDSGEWMSIPSEGVQGGRGLLTTGSSNEYVAKNLFDIAGNVGEMVLFHDGSSPAEFARNRGGNWYLEASAVPVSGIWDFRDAYPKPADNWTGFRIVLYITTNQ